MRTKNLIIALDFPDAGAALDFLNLFGDRRPYVKVGMELYYAEGPALVRALKERGHPVFLDLKLHDIPHTVRAAMAVLGSLGVDMCNLHAAGGKDMMSTALEGLVEGFEKAQGKGEISALERPLLLAVTQLTSMDEERMRRELLIPHPMEETVLHYARNALDAGLDGVVCSPLEARAIKEGLGSGFLTCTPGIRPAGADVGDQRRVTTPAMARAFSDAIVVGRPITRAADPVTVYEQCVREFLGEGLP